MMDRIFFINETVNEIRAAIVENGRPVGYFAETHDSIPEGTIVFGKVMEHAPSLDAYFIDIGSDKKAYIPEKNSYGMKIRQNTIIPFQVLHEERGSKGMYLSCRLMISGDFCICGSINKPGRVSAKIQDEEKRKNLNAVIASFSEHNKEIIIRTIAQDNITEDIRKDVETTLNKLSDIEACKGAPGDILYKPENIIDKIIKNYNPETDKVYFNDITTFDKYFDRYRENSANKGFKHYNKEYDMFDFFSISNKLREAGMRKVRLKSGAEIVFDYTEAMCVIDINSSKNSSPGSFEETALKTNLEAASEIAIQLRLRNIGGIIVIDFIETDVQGMAETDRFFRECLKDDDRRMDIGGFTSLGNYELIRSRKGRRINIGEY